MNILFRELFEDQKYEKFPKKVLSGEIFLNYKKFQENT